MVTNALLACPAGCDQNNALKQDDPSVPVHRPDASIFFVASESDWASHAGAIADQQAKVMKRINNKAVAVEAVLTRHGTVVGAVHVDLTGYPELTPYKGGWCGNDLFPEALSDAHRAKAIELARRLGQEGYKGFIEVDVLVDLDTEEVYLGELNPRISGVSSMANVTVGAYADIPLFLVREVSTRSLHPESVTTVPGRLPRLAGLTLRQREDAEARLAVQTVNTQFSWGSHNTST